MKINIFGLEIEVFLAELDGTVAGLYYPQDKKVLIESRQPEKDIWTTFIHELGHVLLLRTGIGQSVSGDVMEIIVENYSTMLDELISEREKKRIVKKLSSKANKIDGIAKRKLKSKPCKKILLKKPLHTYPALSL